MFPSYPVHNLLVAHIGLPTETRGAAVDGRRPSLSDLAMRFLERGRRALSRLLGSRETGEGVRLRREIIRLYEKKSYREAANAARRLLDLQKKTLGEHHPDYATGLCNLSLLLLKQGDTRGASTWLKKAVSIRRAALGVHHPDTTDAESLLASARRVKPAADPVLLSALAVLDGVLGLESAGRGELMALRDCQQAARSLRDSVASGKAGIEAARLVEGDHPFALLLAFVGRREGLSDADWATFYESVSATLGRPLARAVSRGQVRLASPRTEDRAGR